MALDRDKMLAAMAAGERIPIYKASVANMAAGYIASLWRAAGSPLWAQGAIPGAAAPSITVTVITTIEPSAGTLAMAGNAASIDQPRTLSPAAASWNFTGYAPTMTQPRSLTPGGGAWGMLGQEPGVTQTETTTLDPSGAAFYIIGQLPSFVQGIATPSSTVHRYLYATLTTCRVLAGLPGISATLRSGYIDQRSPYRVIRAFISVRRKP